MKKIDMSSEAITRRLRQVDQLRELSLSLMKAKKESDAKKKWQQPQVAKSSQRVDEFEKQ